MSKQMPLRFVARIFRRHGRFDNRKDTVLVFRITRCDASALHGDKVVRFDMVTGEMRGKFKYTKAGRYNPWQLEREDLERLRAMPYEGQKEPEKNVAQVQEGEIE